MGKLRPPTERSRTAACPRSSRTLRRRPNPRGSGSPRWTGKRTMVAVFDLASTAQIPPLAEPFFTGLNAAFELSRDGRGRPADGPFESRRLRLTAEMRQASSPRPFATAYCSKHSSFVIASAAGVSHSPTLRNYADRSLTRHAPCRPQRASAGAVLDYAKGLAISSPRPNIGDRNRHQNSRFKP